MVLQGSVIRIFTANQNSAVQGFETTVNHICFCFYSHTFQSLKSVCQSFAYGQFQNHKEFLKHILNGLISLKKLTLHHSPEDKQKEKPHI